MWSVITEIQEMLALAKPEENEDAGVVENTEPVQILKSLPIPNAIVIISVMEYSVRQIIFNVFKITHYMFPSEALHVHRIRTVGTASPVKIQASRQIMTRLV